MSSSNDGFKAFLFFEHLFPASEKLRSLMTLKAGVQRADLAIRQVQIAPKVRHVET